MGDAGEADARHVQDHQRQGDIGERAVQFGDEGFLASGAFCLGREQDLICVKPHRRLMMGRESGGMNMTGKPSNDDEDKSDEE